MIFFSFQIKIAGVLLSEYNVPVKEIAILTPYSAQKNKLLKMVDSSNLLQGLKVASITESQGVARKPSSKRHFNSPFFCLQVMSTAL